MNALGESYNRCYALAFEIQVISQKALNRVAPKGKQEKYIDQHAATELANLIYARIVRKQ